MTNEIRQENTNSRRRRPSDRLGGGRGGPHAGCRRRRVGLVRPAAGRARPTGRPGVGGGRARAGIREARQWRTMLDQAETAAKAADAQGRRARAAGPVAGPLLQAANMDVTRLESELAAGAPDDVSSEEPPDARGRERGHRSAGRRQPGHGRRRVEPAAAPGHPRRRAEPAPAGPPRPVEPRRSPAAAASPEKLAIVFDVNSSYLPASLDGRLRDFAAGLEPGRELPGRAGRQRRQSRRRGPAGRRGPALQSLDGRAADDPRSRVPAEERQGREAELSARTSRSNDPSRQVLVEVRPVQE